VGVTRSAANGLRGAAAGRSGSGKTGSRITRRCNY